MKVTANGVRIIGSASAVSENKVNNFDLNPDTASWVESRLGILERRHLGAEDFLIDLIEEAALKAIEKSGICAEDLDAIIIATSTPDFINPSMATILHGRIGANVECSSLDIQAVCAGYIYGLSLVASLIASKAGKYFLLIGADQFSKITDFSHRNSVFFGDAAGALIIEATAGESFLAVETNSQGSGWESFHTAHSTGTFTMNAKEVAQNATTKLPESIRSIAEYSAIKVEDIDWFVTHQPSKTVLDSLENSLALPQGRLLRNIDLRGNTAGATIPLLFDEMKVLELAKSGDYICFSAIGAGWVWGSAVLKWE
jgi:3-oxoacyl-[acyl-carrier-protein] synthase-3